MRVLALLAVTAVSLALAAPASASRAPSTSERSAIRAAMVRKLDWMPARCLTLTVRVSTVDGAFAIARPQWARMMGACAKYAANGDDVLRRRAGVWRVVAAGSDWSSCVRAVPRNVVHDLTREWCS